MSWYWLCLSTSKLAQYVPLKHFLCSCLLPHTFGSNIVLKFLLTKSFSIQTLCDSKNTFCFIIILLPIVAIRLELLWLNLTYCSFTLPVPTWLDLSHIDLICPDLIWPVLTWLCLSWHDFACPDMTCPVLTWPDLSRHDLTCPDMI